MNFTIRGLSQIVLIAAAFFISCAAFADSLSPVIQGESSKVELIRKGKDLNTQYVSESSISAQLYEIYTWYVTVNVDVPYSKCKKSLSQNSGNWHGAFDPTTSVDKPARLAAAIKGLSINTATYLFLDGYFKERPKTWDDFSNEITRADLHYENGLAHRVLVKYGQENMRSLGYFLEHVCEIKTRRETRIEAKQGKRPYKTVCRNFKLIINNGDLLKQESEAISIVFDGINDHVVWNSQFNNYVVKNRTEEGSTVIYELQGKRKLFPTTNTLNVVATNENGNFLLKIVDTAFDPDLGESAGRAYAEVTAYQYRWYWFDKELGTIEVPLSINSPETEISTRLGAARGRKGYVRVKLKRVGSQYYSDGLSRDDRKTYKLRF